MKIPKYISHPLIIILGGALVLSMVWVSQSQEASKILGNRISEPDWKNYHIVQNVFETGSVKINDDIFSIADERLANLEFKQFVKFKALLFKRFIHKEALTKNKVLNLPLTFLNKECIQSSQYKSIDQCKIILQK